MGFAETAPLVATLDLKGNFAAQLRKNQGALGSFSAAMGRAGRGAGQIGAGLARVGAIAGAVAVGGLVAAGKAAIDFQDAFAGVRKTVDETDLTKAGLSFDSLAKSFRNMATEIPIAATEFARIGEAAGALGVKAQDIESFTKTVALLGVTTNLTTEVAAEDLGKLGTILHLTSQGYTDLADTLVNLGNQGASTESEIIEITKRFAAQGRQAGLTVNQILALASATASLGVEPEAGGSALSRVFSNMSTELALASKKGIAFAQVTAGVFDDLEKLDAKGKGSHAGGIFDTKAAKELTDLQESVRGGGALSVFQKFLVQLSKLDRLQAATALKGVGITNVRDRNAVLLMAQSIGEVNRQLDVANHSTGALSVEATKRFDTIKSKLQVLKQNFIEAGIVIGEGFLPALGRAAEKLTAFLKVDANRAALKSFGEDIGKALDGVDWNSVLAGAKTFYGVLKTIFDVLNALPTEIKAAGAAFLVLNKASGGLIGAGAGNIIGGLGSAAITGAASRAPGVGRLFAQPVFVTNWAMMGGGLGGPAGAVGRGLGLVSKMFLVGEAIGLGLLVNEIRQNQGDQNTARAVAIAETQAEWLSQQPSRADLERGLSAVEKGIRDIESNPLSVLVQGEALDTLRKMRADLQAQLQKTSPGLLGLGAIAPALAHALVQPGLSTEARSAAMRGIVTRATAAGFKPTSAAVNATWERNVARQAAALKAAADALTSMDTRSELAGIRNAVAAAKPPITNVNVTVNVTAAQVTKATVVQRRFGPSGGSRERGPREFD